MGLFDKEDLLTAVGSGLAGSSNPFLSGVGGLLGGGGGSGSANAQGAFPPAPPAAPAPSAGAGVGSLALPMGWVVGGIFLVVVAALAMGVRGGR